MSYTDRLQRLNLPTLKYRRLRGDMIEVFNRYITQTCHLNWYIIQTLIPEVTNTNYLTNHFPTTHENTVFLHV